MEKPAIPSPSEIKKVIIFALFILNIIGLIACVLGAVRWFHFPYLLFLDEWHFLWLTVALSGGLILSLLILDHLVIQNLSHLLVSSPEDFLTTELKFIFIFSILGVLGITIIELIMISWEISSALRGLVNLGVGVSCLWSSRFYWIAVFQHH